MIKDKMMGRSKTNFAENLFRILELPEDLITDHYYFGKTIGLGQYGTVKEAFSLENPDEKVAVKILDLKSLSKTFRSIC